jgi:DNA polymerase-1
MKNQEPIAIDFETFAIEPRPSYPPKPVGVAVMDRTGQFENKYWAWGHPTENNCTYEEGLEVLQKILQSGRPILMHNAQFDLCVMTEGMGLPFPHWSKIHDTLVSAALHDPYAQSYALKTLCKEWLGTNPDERDELFEWLVANVDEAAKKPKSAGAYIALAPGGLVGKYAAADVRLTLDLYDFTAKAREDMQNAYEIEMRLMEPLLDNSRQGIRVDREGLQTTLNKALVDLADCDLWLDKFFEVEPQTVNYNSGDQLVPLLFAKDVVDKTKDWPLSPKSRKPLSDKVTIEELVSDKLLVSVLRHRDTLVKLKGTYIEPWLEVSKTTGKIYTSWNSVRGEFGGTRTGRLSCTPSMQTMPSRGPKEPLPEELQHIVIPKLRQFIIADEGHAMVGCDYNAQELRAFAHYTGGELAAQYEKDPKADLHTYAKNLISSRVGRDVPRDHCKTVAFAVLYGAGPKKISEMLNIDIHEARLLVDAYKSEVATGMGAINKDLERRYKLRAPFRTIGGRLVKGEPPKFVNGKMMEFGYKSLNALIQGSCADMAKKATVDYWDSKQDSRLLLLVHDEVIISAKKEHAEREAENLSKCMVNAYQMSVPMVAEAVIGNNYMEIK